VTSDDGQLSAVLTVSCSERSTVRETLNKWRISGLARKQLPMGPLSCVRHMAHDSGLKCMLCV